MLTSDAEGKNEPFENDPAQSPAQKAANRKHVTVSSGDTKARIQCEHCEKSFTLMTNKNRHVRKAHGVIGYGDNKSPVSNQLPNNQQTQQLSNGSIQFDSVTQSLAHSSESFSDDSNANNGSTQNASNSDNSLLMAALNESLGSHEPPTTMITELLNVINQDSLPVEAGAPPANKNASSTSERANQIAHIAAVANCVAPCATSPSLVQGANHHSAISAQLATAPIPLSIGAGAEIPANQIPVPDLTYEDTKHQVVVTVTAAKHPQQMMMAEDSTTSSSSGSSPMSQATAPTTNENASIAISESNFVESGLGSATTCSPSLKARGGGGRGRRRNHVTGGGDPTTSCSSPSQSSDGSASGEGATFPTRLHHGRYVCGICEASFTFQTNLTRHQRKLHGKPYVRNPRKNERESPPGARHHTAPPTPTTPGRGRSPPAPLGAGVPPRSAGGEMGYETSYLNSHHLLPGHLPPPPPQTHDSPGSNSFHHQPPPAAVHPDSTQHETSIHHELVQPHETPVQHDVMLTRNAPGGGGSPDNTDAQLMEQTPTAMKVEAEATQHDSPADRYTDLSSYESTIPYSAL